MGKNTHTNREVRGWYGTFTLPKLASRLVRVNIPETNQEICGYFGVGWVSVNSGTRGHPGNYTNKCTLASVKCECP